MFINYQIGQWEFQTSEGMGHSVVWISNIPLEQNVIYHTKQVLWYQLLHSKLQH